PRVRIEGDRARGVDYRTSSGATGTITARRGVIISAGAIESPKLLLLSGIGPRDELRAYGVDVVFDSPGVGGNLQEHPVAGILVGVNVPTPNMDLTALGVARHAVEFLVRGTGGATAPPAAAFAFGRIEPTSPHIDYELAFAPYGMTAAPNGPRDDLLHGGLAPMKTPAIRLGVWCCHPQSRGTVTLRSRHSQDPVRIHHQLVTGSDVAVLTAAAR